MLRREYVKSLLGLAAPTNLERARPQGSETVVKKMIDVCVRGGELDAIDELVAPTFRCHGSFGDWDREAWMRSVEWLHAAVAGVAVDVHETISAGERVTIRWSLHGTHRETGRRLRIDGISVETVELGRVVESYIAADVLPCLHELGRGGPSVV